MPTAQSTHTFLPHPVYPVICRWYNYAKLNSYTSFLLYTINFSLNKLCAQHTCSSLLHRVSLSIAFLITFFLWLFCFKLRLCQKEKKLKLKLRQQQRLCFLWRLCAKLISILLPSDWDLNGVPLEINSQCKKKIYLKKERKNECGKCRQ